jgi:hypothetical protein
LGFLSIGHTEPNRYTQDHLRRAELLAIPAAAAIQNARLYSTADVYGSELQKRLVDLQEAETAGIFRDPRLLIVTFCDWRCNGWKTKKTSDTAKILGFEGVKVVSAEGIEPSTYIPASGWNRRTRIL